LLTFANDHSAFPGQMVLHWVLAISPWNKDSEQRYSPHACGFIQGDLGLPYGLLTRKPTASKRLQTPRLPRIAHKKFTSTSVYQPPSLMRKNAVD
jgi:hypothetical protein